MTQHLKQGELEELFLYLEPMESIEEEDTTLGEVLGTDISTLVRVKHVFDQDRAAVLDYATRSSFGRTREEITQNARLHIASCYPCFARYVTDVQKRVLGNITGLEAVLKDPDLKQLQFSVELFYMCLKMWDYLGILKSHIK